MATYSRKIVCRRRMDMGIYGKSKEFEAPYDEPNHPVWDAYEQQKAINEENGFDLPLTIEEYNLSRHEWEKIYP